MQLHHGLYIFLDDIKKQMPMPRENTVAELVARSTGAREGGETCAG